uniref:Uncharacterized protein n=1 Tax=Kalanchoe fedtschenkoi TaxID=63787 RepID=A0A7N0TTI1_KALFE
MSCNQASRGHPSFCLNAMNQTHYSCAKTFNKCLPQFPARVTKSARHFIKHAACIFHKIKIPSNNLIACFSFTTKRETLRKSPQNIIHTILCLSSFYHLHFFLCLYRRSRATMNSLSATVSNVNFPNCAPLELSKTTAFLVSARNASRSLQFTRVSCKIRAQSGSFGSRRNCIGAGHGEQNALVEDLSVPEYWMTPSKAKEESEWLRETLHKWLDDEYCPEETNIEISKVAAQSLYNSLVEKDGDIGVILLKMAKDLQAINYQESFHGAFSSANAAMDLVMQRIEKSLSPID